MRSSDAKVGDVIETSDGSLYLVLPQGYRAYLGHADWEYSETRRFVLSMRNDEIVKKRGKIQIERP
jgi:hypothetical protein